MMNIKNLSVNIGDKTVLKGFDVKIEKGTVHAIMGLNGSGKSTLAKAIVGHYDVQVTDGEILYKGKNILDMPPERRALEGLFLSFQNPVEIPGVNNAYFLRTALNAKREHQGKKTYNAAEFLKQVTERVSKQTEANEVD